MTEAAQEHLTGMPTPGPLAMSLAQMLTEWVDGSNGGDWRSGLPAIIQKRIDRFEIKAVNAYGSTDALRSALEKIAGGFEGEGLEIENQWRMETARAALSGSPAPSSPSNDLIETLREIEKQCIQADDPEHHTLNLVKHMARNALKGAGEGLRETADQNIGHGHVWKRPDGLVAKCGGPALCSECAGDQLRLREAVLFSTHLDIALLIRAKDNWHTRALRAEKNNTEIPRMREALELISGGFEGEGLEIENQWRIETARAALSGSPAPSEGLREWQPIAGAPRDQNIIVAAMNTYSKTWIVGEARWQSDDPDHPDDGDWWWANISPGDYTGDSIMNMNGAVEFWQPLPLPPDAARTALAGVTAPQEVDAK